MNRMAAELDSDRVRKAAERRLRLIGEFESRLKSIDLSRESIASQSVNELNDSIVKIEVEIDRVRSRIAAMDPTSDSFEGRYEKYPLVKLEKQLSYLIDRKEDILEHLRRSTDRSQLEKLRQDTAKSDNDATAIKESVLSFILQQERNAEVFEKKIEEASQEKSELYDLSAKVALFERKVQVWHSLLERESVATIVGAFILIIFTLCLTIAMFTGFTPSEVITNAFLLILGYFFGQSTAKKHE
jgi:hypothetical protein